MLKWSVRLNSSVVWTTQEKKSRSPVPIERLLHAHALVYVDRAEDDLSLYSLSSGKTSRG